jgi:phage tail sheath protein FI
MPIAVSYPGVYIDEVPSGVRSITGVATSITAFIGRSLRGPVDEPVLVNSFADYERRFGGLWLDSALGYAVRDFYLNGGSQAIVVRLYHAATVEGVAQRSRAALVKDSLSVEALYDGAWGNKLQMRIDYQVLPPDPHRFNLSVRDGGTGQIEVFLDVSIEPAAARRIDKVLASESRLIAAPTLPATRPAAHDALDTTTLPPQADVWAKVGEGKTHSAVGAADSASDGDALKLADFNGAGMHDQKKGMYALRKADLFNLLCIPPYLKGLGGDALDGDVDLGLVAEAAVFCEQRRAMLLVDARSDWNSVEKVIANVGTAGTNSKNAALFFPRLVEPIQLRDNALGRLAPCGAVAGIFARTDTQRGVWKAPAGLDAVLVGVPQLSVPLTDAENGQLNPLGVNCLRSMPAAGRVVWGARTLQGDDRLVSEWKYIPVRRTALYIEESLYRGTQWVVFEPNDEPLWAQIRLNLGAFMHGLFRQGAFQGKTPQQAYFVKCDKETTTQNDVDLGIVNIAVGFAPLKPAEFVIIKLQQIAGQIQT